MTEFGFMRVAACVPEMSVGDTRTNADRITAMINEAASVGAHVAVFPELCITGYTCADLFSQQLLGEMAIEALALIMDRTASLPIVSVIGLPFEHANRRFNAACVICGGKIAGISVKTYIPNYNEFYEKRWFASGAEIEAQSVKIFGSTVPIGNDIVYVNEQWPEMTFSVEICEDLWAPVPPSIDHSFGGALAVFNLSASNELIGKADYRRSLVCAHSARTVTGYVYVSAGIGESSTDTVYGGHSIIAEYGTVLTESERFFTGASLIYSDIDLQRLRHDRNAYSPFMEYSRKKEMRKAVFSMRPVSNEKLVRKYEARPFVPAKKETLDARCREIFSIQTAGLYKRIRHIGCKKAVVGISGGLDSTLALLVTEKTFEMAGMPKSDIIAVTMPGFGTTEGTYKNAVELAGMAGAELRETDITDACLRQFADIGHDPGKHNIVYENVQARQRTMLLMNISNKEGGILVGTGDLSEIALGWSTYNGDHMSMYAVNCGVPKTLVRFLIDWVADNEVDEKQGALLRRIADTPISPELLPPDSEGRIAQKTEEVIGPYELHDFFLYHMIRFGSKPEKIAFLACCAFEGAYTEKEIRKWLKVFCSRFFANQYKRSCIPDGPKVGTVALSPRADWRMPSDASAAIWTGSFTD